MDDPEYDFQTIDEYIAAFPAEVQQKLNELRQVIKAAAPQAGEKISYRMPTFTLEGNLVHFAAYKKHIGFYPASSGIAHFQQELSAYKTSKGAVQFPVDQPIPYDLVRRMVAFRVQENLERATAKKKKSK
jgi:uncharacterized protein YdhG (YjbR/CyaY superfamily)